MTTLNDSIRVAVGGGVIADGLAVWYGKTAAETLQDAERRWLNAQLGLSPNYVPINDLWMLLLTQYGYAGTLQDKLFQYWSDQATVKNLFAAGEQGAKYEPWDLSTLFQDAAGSIPVTAMEQPVGRMLDKSGRGNHASQTVAVARPVVSARVNLLTYSEQLDNAAWVSNSIVASADSGLWALKATAAGTATRTFQQTISFPANTQAVASFDLKAGELGWATASLFDSGSKGVRVNINLLTGQIGSRSDFNSPVNPSVSLVERGNGVYRVTLSCASASGGCTVRVYPANGDDTSTFPSTATNTTNPLIFAGRVQLEYGPVATRYQRINTATDYDTAGFPVYLRYDGADDGLSCPVGITLPNTGHTIIGAISRTGYSWGSMLEVSNGSSVTGTSVSVGLGGTGAAGNAAHSRVDTVGMFNQTLTGANNITDGRPHVIGFEVNSSAPAVRRVSTDTTVTANAGVVGSTSFAPQMGISLGREYPGHGSNSFVGNIFGAMYINRILTPAEYAAASRDFAQKSGWKA